jgi:hypothetical protein
MPPQRAEHGRGQGEGSGSDGQDIPVVVICTAMICGTIIYTTQIIANACGQTSQRWEKIFQQQEKLGKNNVDTRARTQAITGVANSAHAIGELAQDIRMGHEEDIRPGSFLTQVGNAISSIRLGQGPSGNH